MPYHSGNAVLNGTSIKNMRVSTSSITTSTLDMNLQNITSVKDPIQLQDAATKKYVDNVISTSFNVYAITLSGSIFTDAIALQPGAYTISISAVSLSGAPTANWSVAKSSSDGDTSIFRMASVPSSSGETLDIVWHPNAPLRVRKTGANYDGIYNVRIS